VVSEAQAAERLLSICPGFQPRWQRELDRSEGKRFGEYVDLGILADWVVDQMIAGQVACFSSLFAEVETLLHDASTDVRNLLVIGLLEDIQLWVIGKYGAKASKVDPDRFLSFLGNETRREWFALVRYWDRWEPGKWTGKRED
jgi:hypothetical protein